MDEHLQTLEHAQQTAIDLAIQFGPKLVVALLILVAGFYVGRWVGKLTLARLGLAASVCQLLVRVVRTLVMGLFVIMALQNLGIELLPLLAGLGVAGAGIALALAAIRELLAAHPKILQEPEPMIRVLTLADSGVEIAIRPWTTVDNFYDTSSDITQAVLETFRARGISIPFPQREVRLLGQP